MCLGPIGDVLQSIDHFANGINPMHGIMDSLANDASKIPGVGGALGAAGKFGADKPAEAYMAYLGAAAGGEALAGAGAAGAGAGVAADGTAMGSAAGTLGAADSAGASASLGLTAADVGGTSGAVAGSGAATAAGTGGSALANFAGTAAKTLGPALLSSALQPKPPKVAPVAAMPDPLAQEQAQRQKIIDQIARRGRASTILTSATNGTLGG